MAQDPVCGMTVNEKKSFSADLDGKTYFFCSQHCLDKFCKKKNISKESLACIVPSKRPFYANKTFIISGVLVGLVAVSGFLPILVPFRNTLLAYFKTIWWAITLGLFLGGIIEYYIPREYISLILAHPGKRTIFYSVLLGFLMSICSHGILALSIQLHKKGASNPSVVAFLLASPWANMVLTIMLIGFFGLKAFYIIFSAIAVAITTGLIFQFLERKKIIETNKLTASVEKGFSIKEDIKKRFK
ncbi:MAG: permease, partial [Candidatus Omnitrophica bacterium]|nr:permease [Candidatus Omnitrophota bacterium]